MDTDDVGVPRPRSQSPQKHSTCEHILPRSSIRFLLYLGHRLTPGSDQVIDSVTYTLGESLQSETLEGRTYLRQDPQRYHPHFCRPRPPAHARRLLSPPYPDPSLLPPRDHLCQCDHLVRRPTCHIPLIHLRMMTDPSTDTNARLRTSSVTVMKTRR